MSWNGSNNTANTSRNRSATPRRTSPWRGLVAGAIVVLGAAVAAWYFLGRAGAPSPTAPAKKGGKIATVQHVTVTNRVKKAKAEKPAEKKAPVEKKPEFVKRPGALQLPDGQVLTFPPPQGDEIRKVYAYGHMYECDSKGNFRDVTKRQLFHTAFEGNFFALAQEGKAYIPAFLTGLDEQKVLDMLQKPYEPIGDETEEEKEQLAAYDRMRNAALDYIAEGGKFDDFVTEIARFEKQERQTQAVCLREVMTLVKQGKAQEAKDVYEASLKLTADKNFRPIRLPPYVQKTFDQMK